MYIIFTINSSAAPPLALRMIQELHRLALVCVRVCARVRVRVYFSETSRCCVSPVEEDPLKIRTRDAFSDDPSTILTDRPWTHHRHLGWAFAFFGLISQTPLWFCPLARGPARIPRWRTAERGLSAGMMAEHLSRSELDYPFKLLEYFNGFRVSKVTSWFI